MAEAPVLTKLVNLENETTAVNAINANSTAITTAFEDVLSLSGTAPNQMQSPFDMNSFQIINLPAPVTGNSPVRLTDINTLIDGGTISNIPAGGTTGQVLSKTSNTDYAIGWENGSGSLPAPTASTLGGVNSLTPVTSQWINSIATTGLPTQTQPAFTDISGVATAAQMPAFTGDVTTTSGGTAAVIAANAVTNAKAAQMAAYTIKGNATSGTANSTDLSIPALTHKSSVANGDFLLIADSANSNSLAYVTVSQVAAGSTVASIAGNTGAFTLTGGITNSTNAIKRAFNEAHYAGSPGSAPTGTASTSGVMMGLGGTFTITPTTSTRVLVHMQATMTGSTANSYGTWTMQYGTGTAPTNGAAGTGTQVGAITGYQFPVNNYFAGTTNDALLTGLTAGTAYWFDIFLVSSTVSSTMSLNNVYCSLLEV